MNRWIILSMVVGLIVVGLWAVQKEPSSAQPDAQTMRVMIEDLSARGKTMIFTFAEPVAPNLTIYETNGQDLRVGDDFVCISEPWNDGRRFRCTPYSNVVSVSFVD